MNESKHYDIIILGGGSGGLGVAYGAANLGLKVALVDKADVLGGDCLNFGCVPTKALLASAEYIHSLKNFKKFGIDRVDHNFYFKDLIKRMRDRQAHIAINDSKERFEKMGIDVYLSESPKFLDRKSIKIKKQTLHTKRFVIATGSRPKRLKTEGLENAGYITNEDVFELDRAPKDLVIVGGGPIGVEMAFFFSQVGSSVTMLLNGTHILSREDEEVSVFMENKLREYGVKFEKEADISRIEKKGKKKMIFLENKKNITCEEILISVGRDPNTEGLDLKKAGVNLSEKGIMTDKRLRTSARNIYAVGDVIGEYMFTHVAELHAGIALGNILSPIKRSVKGKVIPWVTYTVPEVARVGITAKEAQNKNIKHKVFTYDLENIDRAIVSEKTDGFIKLVLSGKGKILGVSIVCENAGELISEYVLAMSAGLNITAVSKAVHVYPTLSQINKRVADRYISEKIFSNGAKKIVGFLKRFWI